jgi:hypothetical protein
MTNRRVAGIAMFALAAGLPLSAADFDVRSFGAKGDGKTPDRDAINKPSKLRSGRRGNRNHPRRHLRDGLYPPA